MKNTVPALYRGKIVWIILTLAFPVMYYFIARDSGIWSRALMLRQEIILLLASFITALGMRQIGLKAMARGIESKFTLSEILQIMTLACFFVLAIVIVIIHPELIGLGQLNIP